MTFKYFNTVVKLLSKICTKRTIVTSSVCIEIFSSLCTQTFTQQCRHSADDTELYPPILVIKGF